MLYSSAWSCWGPSPSLHKEESCDHSFPAYASQLSIIYSGDQDPSSDTVGHPHATHDLEGPPLHANSIQGQHTISVMDLAKLNQVARQQPYFAMMNRRTDSLE
jgi:hypothetical protein